MIVQDEVELDPHGTKAAVVNAKLSGIIDPPKYREPTQF